jgi:hypothetical protein
MVGSFGPFSRGVVDGVNTALETKGALRFARNARFDGVGRLLARPGTQLAMTLKDDGGVPANVTSVLAIVPFADGALAIAHSTVTSNFYLYRFDADLSGWYNAAGVFQANLNASPIGVLWASALSAPVFIAEGLGEAFIAHSNAGSSFRTKRYSVAGGILNLDADLRGAGVEATYFRGLVSFQQHLWGWGYGSEIDRDRPELARFGLAIFGTSAGGYFAASDSITVGHRVRSYRERIVVGVTAGDVLYFATPETIWPVTGFGRNSWDKSRPIDQSFGFAGARAGVEVNGVLYYWSRRGPMRVEGVAKPQPLWLPLPVAAKSVVNPTGIVAAYDSDTDQVIWHYQNGTSGRVSVLAALDVERDVFLGPDGDIGLGIACAGLVQPIGAAGPTGPPTTPSTTGIGQTVATGNLLAGDTSAGTKTIWEIKKTTDLTWVSAAETEPTQLAKQFTGLVEGATYHWRAKHRKNGQDSAYLGPVAGTTFTTVAVLQPPTNCQVVTTGLHELGVSWLNSGEAGVSTEVYLHLGVNPPTALANTVDPGAANSIHSALPDGIHYARVRHIKAGLAPSAYSNVASGDPSIL